MADRPLKVDLEASLFGVTGDDGGGGGAVTLTSNFMPPKQYPLVVVK